MNDINDIIVNKKILMDFCIKALKKVGVSDSDAEIAAEVLTTNEMRGIQSHGVIALNGYIKNIKLGLININATLETVREGTAWTLVDANSGLGMVTAFKAMKIAINKARQNGIGMVSVRNSQHFSAAGYYSSMCAAENMIGLAMSNTPKIMTIPGLSGRVIGTNPLSYALPVDENLSVCLDIAMSQVALGKVTIAHKENRAIPEGWMVDSKGNPTTDPGKYYSGGALLPFGGYKGYGLAVMVEALSAMLSGTETNINDRTGQQDKGIFGHLFIAIDIDQIIPIQDFKYRIGQFIKELKNSPKAEMVKDIFLPGEIEALHEKDSAKNGIKLGQATINELKALADDLKLDINF